jgi:hypothetical protein
MAAKLTTLTHKIAIQLCLVAESCTICSSRSRRPVRKLFGYILVFVLVICGSVSLQRSLTLPEKPRNILSTRNTCYGRKDFYLHCDIFLVVLTVAYLHTWTKAHRRKTAKGCTQQISLMIAFLPLSHFNGCELMDRHCWVNPEMNSKLLENTFKYFRCVIINSLEAKHFCSRNESPPPPPCGDRGIRIAPP